jgi:hypothetical protein
VHGKCVCVHMLVLFFIKLHTNYIFFTCLQHLYGKMRHTLSELCGTSAFPTHNATNMRKTYNFDIVCICFTIFPYSFTLLSHCFRSCFAHCFTCCLHLFKHSYVCLHLVSHVFYICSAFHVISRWVRFP